MVFFVLKIRGVDASDMHNPIPQYNILNKGICKICKDYVVFSYPGIVFPYTLYNMPIPFDTLFLTWAICLHQIMITPRYLILLLLFRVNPSILILKS